MRTSMVVFVTLALVAAANAGPVFTMTFEEPAFQATDVLPVEDYYTGVTFGSSSTGSPLVSRNYLLGNYNVSSWPSGNSTGSGEYWMYGNVGVTSALDASGNDGQISFDYQDATFVEIGYCASSTFWLEAYRADGTLIDTASGPGNRRYLENNPNGPGTLRVDWNGTDYIAWVIVHDQGDYWVIDNVTTDASSIGYAIPLPGAVYLGAIGLGLIARRFRR